MRNAEGASAFNLIATAILAGAAGLAATILIAAITLAVAPRQAEALPQYAKQTGLVCGQCHVNPKGGGTLTPLGERFKAQGHKLN
jgi:mono/diheme cytochrome c family protein